MHESLVLGVVVNAVWFLSLLCLGHAFCKHVPL